MATETSTLSPPALAALMMYRLSLLNSLPRLASTTALWRMMFLA